MDFLSILFLSHQIYIIYIKINSIIFFSIELEYMPTIIIGIDKPITSGHNVHWTIVFVWDGTSKLFTCWNQLSCICSLACWECVSSYHSRILEISDAEYICLFWIQYIYFPTSQCVINSYVLLIIIGGKLSSTRTT